MEYLLLTLDFGEILFLLAGFGSLQAALLKVFEPRRHGGTFDGPRRITAVLWRAEAENQETFQENTERKHDGLRVQIPDNILELFFKHYTHCFFFNLKSCFSLPE